MKLVKEVPFGKAVARIAVEAFENEINLDGDVTGTETITTTKIEIVANGKVVETARSASMIEFNELTDTLYHSRKLDVSKKYTKVGDRIFTQGHEIGIAINEAIAEMVNELTQEEEVEIEEIEIAKETVTLAEKEGTENLMTAAQLKKWRRNYNDLHNEGEEGYIPIRISKEAHREALELLKRKDVAL
ncbi:hypothetical protein [Oceanobacillus sp. CF4.6]|uniref:hypothetical protein n=1 Tax=Oceanobacillus sp. CF4.6 TaxID=3373080 RepID=UPI003EE5B465